ncbi:MAG: class I SAM-dependent methyltransferase [Phycisphaerales bacterium]|nr:class I SAM-dependent methyltransferase [Phycisphaerales bacterium]
MNHPRVKNSTRTLPRAKAPGQGAANAAASASSLVKKRSASQSARMLVKNAWRTAATSDHHELYELAVQTPKDEAKFIDKVFKSINNRLPATFREDFCGTHILSSTWVVQRASNHAYGVDLDASVLAWGAARRKQQLSHGAHKRLHIEQGNVLSHKGQLVDVVAAFNFSYYIFKKRAQLLRYFKFVRTRLKTDGVFFLDCYGGYESFSEQSEELNLDGFTYIWDTAKYNPISGEVLNHIHFKFPDGTQIRKAFTYDWRLWTIAELQELLADAGFTSSTVYWEGTDHATGSGNGIFCKATQGEACAGWIAYIAAEK